ncbi:MAG: glycosyltransferase family 39 protein [Deltaproteobacteria bacterium]|nr:glycosyltransferase family 39 protein [Deltaproteobacteria bacterium]MBI3389023.1 glycosyltransferase family 39 protein [Deltaproteobacteria bacterium]
MVDTKTREPLWLRATWLTVPLALMVAFAWASYQRRYILLNPWGDNWVHLTYIRATIAHGWFPGDAFYGGPHTPPYYCLADIVLAGVCALTGQPPHVVWLALPPVIAVTTMAAIFVWLRALTGDDRIAVIGAATEMLVSVPDQTWTAMPLPRTLAVAPLALGLYCYLRGCRAREWPWLIAAGIALGVSLATHLFVGGAGLLSLGALDLSLNWPRRRPSRELAIVATLGLTLATPWIANVAIGWLHRAPTSAKVFTITPEVLTLPLGPMSLRLHHPLAVLNVLPSAVWLPVALGVGLTLWRCHEGRARVVDRYVLIATAGALIILFTPFYGLLLAIAGVWTARVVQVVPLSLLAGIGIVGGFDRLRSSTRLGRLRIVATTVGVLLVAFVVWSVTGNIRAGVGGTGWGYFTQGPLGDWNLVDKIAQTGPVPRVVLSDPWTSYLLPYYVGCSVLVMPAMHGSAYEDHLTREQAAGRVFRPRTPIAEVRRTLDEYQIDALAIARNQPWPQAGDADDLLVRLRRHPAFLDTGCCDQFVLLRYLPQGES